MNEIINIDRLSQMLGIETLKQDVERLKRQVGNPPAQPVVDIDALKSKIKNLQKQVDDLTHENSQLKSDAANLESQKTQLESKATQLESQKAKLESQTKQLESTQTKLEAKNTELQNQLRNYDFLTLYNQLDDDTKSEVSYYFPCANNNALIYTALQEKNVMNFYKYIRSNVNKSGGTNIAPELMAMLRMVFEFYTQAQQITLIEPQIGDPLNSDEHTAKGYNQESGSPITEVLLFGFRDKEGKVVNTALVKA